MMIILPLIVGLVIIAYANSQENKRLQKMKDDADIKRWKGLE